MKENFLEKEPTKNRIHLVIFRHDEKEKNSPVENDTQTPLTFQGEERAYDSAKKLEVSNPQRLITSIRERVLQTGLLKLASTQGVPKADAIGKSTQHLSNLVNQKFINNGDTTRKMLHRDNRLNFDYESDEDFGRVFYEIYGEKDNNRTLFWQVQQSDDFVLQLSKEKYNDGLMKVSTYKRLAGDMAEMIYRYFKALDKLKFVRKVDGEDENFDLDILMGTHSQNLECFLMRLIEIKEGPNKLREFLDSLENHKGFIDFSEDISVDITENQIDGMTRKELMISFRDKEWHVDHTNLQQMIHDRNVFNEKVRAQLDAIKRM